MAEGKWISALTADTPLAAPGPNQALEFERFVAETVAAVREPRADHEGQTLLDLARPLLTGRLRALDEAAAQDLDDYARLHQVRIAGKRLRYAMEVFAPCFDASFREGLYPRVEEMQEILGRANDSHVAEARLTALRDRLRGSAPREWKRYQPAV